MKYQLIVDSGCDLTPELAQKHNVLSVPLKISIDGKEYVDDENINMSEYLDALAKTKSLPKSSCPSPGEYADAFMAADADWVFAVTLSSKLSGSYNSALQAAQIVAQEGKKVHVFDSKSASAAPLLIALKISELFQKDLGPEEIIRLVEEYIDRTQIYFVLESTDNLVKNGRMNAFLGKALAALNIRLVLGSDGEGEIKLFSKVRGSSKVALENLARTITDDCKREPGRLVISHCQNEAGANLLSKALEELCPFEEKVILPTRALSSMYADVGGVMAAFNK